MLLIQHVPIAAQITDTLTKPLETDAFQDLRSKLKVTFEGHSPWGLRELLEMCLAKLFESTKLLEV